MTENTIWGQIRPFEAQNWINLDSLGSKHNILDDLDDKRVEKNKVIVSK